MTWVLALLLGLVAILAAALTGLSIWVARRTRAERLVRANEERFLHTLDRAPVILWTARPDGSLDYFNQTCVEYLGMPVEKLRNEGWQDAIHPEDRDALIRAYTPAMEARVPFLAEYRARRADGVYRWILTTGVPKFASDGGYAGYVGCDLDITERKLAEDQVRESRAALEGSYHEIQQLAGRLIEAQDAERARIARDLHDDVSQQLAGLSIALSSIKRRMDDLHVSEDLKEDLRSIYQRSSTLAKNVRLLSHDLHPTVLRHAGLLASLNSYCAELGRLHGTTLTCTAEGDIESISPEVALCLYRIAQEALRNVIAHAGATRAEVRLWRLGDVAEIIIEDNGKGFDVARVRERGKGLGLVSIAERARFVGGAISVTAQSNQGTRVRVQVPAHASIPGGNGAGAAGGGS